MPRDTKLLSDSELLAEESAIKKKLSDLDSRQGNMPHSSFVATRQHLDAQLEMVLSEVRHREHP